MGFIRYEASNQSLSLKMSFDFDPKLPKETTLPTSKGN